MMAQILGWTATFLFTVCYIPQIIKTLKTKTIDGLSISLFLIQFIANLVALSYAFLIGQTPLIVKYILALFMLLIVLITIFYSNQQK